MEATEKTMEERTGLRSLELLYRPVFDWEEQARVCYQSQLRINGANMGVLLPWQYLPVAERTDQCCQLGRWAVEQACTDLAALAKRGVGFEWISVYCSLRLLAQEDFPAFVLDCLRDREVQPEQLCLELSSALLLNRDTRVERSLEMLRDAGIRVILSGFGEDGCPVMRLPDASVDLVGLDGEATAQLMKEEGDRGRAAVISLIQLIRGQELGLIADGVSTRAQAEAAAQAGCLRTTGAFAGAYAQRRGIRA